VSYQTKAEAYADPDTRARIYMCEVEQAYVFVNDGRPDIAQLADRVIAGEPTAQNALASGVCASPNGDNLTEDGPLLSAMQSVWPVVAAALYVEPESEPEPEPEP